MPGKFVNMTYDANFFYKLKPGEFLDLRAIQRECELNGVACKNNKSHLIVDLQDIKFQVFANGRIGWAWLKSPKEVYFLEDSLIPFFWKNFACKCIGYYELISAKGTILKIIYKYQDEKQIANIIVKIDDDNRVFYCTLKGEDWESRNTLQKTKVGDRFTGLLFVETPSGDKTTLTKFAKEINTSKNVNELNKKLKKIPEFKEVKNSV